MPRPLPVPAYALPDAREEPYANCDGVKMERRYAALRAEEQALLAAERDEVLATLHNSPVTQTRRPLA
jgi:hypothetical protein